MLVIGQTQTNILGNGRHFQKPVKFLDRFFITGQKTVGSPVFYRDEIQRKITPSAFSPGIRSSIWRNAGKIFLAV